MKESFDIIDEWLPLEIHPETPSEGMPLANLFSASSVEGMYKNLRKMGSEYGIEFNTISILSNSHLSLAAGEYAKEKEKFHGYHEGIFHAYFTEGKDIGNMNVVLDAAEAVGLDREELKKRLVEGYYDEVLNNVGEEAKRNRINSTPTFIIDEKYAVVGAQPIENFKNTIMQIERDI